MNVTRLDLKAARAALAAHQEAFGAFARRLIEQNQTTNLTRIDTLAEIQSRHFLDSLAGLSVLDAAAGQAADMALIDVGSGAGFPGLAIAIARPQWRIVSLEATEKKVRFQQEVCRLLGLTNVDVRHGRAESMAHDRDWRERFDAVAARAVAGLDVLAELTLGFVRTGGLGLFWKGPQAQEEIAAALPAMEAMGGRLSCLYAYELPEADAVRTLAAVEKLRAAPCERPRRNFAAIRKRPVR